MEIAAIAALAPVIPVLTIERAAIADEVLEAIASVGTVLSTGQFARALNAGACSGRS